jgi:hypothetical protein
LLAAGLVSFFALAVAPYIASPILLELISNTGEIGPLALPIFTHGPFLEAFVGAIFLSVVCAALTMAQGVAHFPDPLPVALSLPVCELLILPSWLEHGGSVLAWLVFGAMAAGAFSFHWRVFLWARTIWD